MENSNKLEVLRMLKNCILYKYQGEDVNYHIKLDNTVWKLTESTNLHPRVMLDAQVQMNAFGEPGGHPSTAENQLLAEIEPLQVEILNEPPSSPLLPQNIIISRLKSEKYPDAATLSIATLNAESSAIVVPNQPSAAVGLSVRSPLSELPIDAPALNIPFVKVEPPEVMLTSQNRTMLKRQLNNSRRYNTYSIVNLVKGRSGPSCLRMMPIPGPPDPVLESFMNMPETSVLNISVGTEERILNRFENAFDQN